MADIPAPFWWSRAAYADRRPFLEVRARLAAAMRAWFAGEGFVEVETPILQISPGNETHLHAFATDMVTPAGVRAPFFLHTSPEFSCRKLLAAGETKLFTLARAFRNRERGALHHPEFTMLEWYRANAPYEALMADCAALLALAAKAGDTSRFTFCGLSADLYATPQRLGVADAFTQFAGIDLLATLGDSEPDVAAFAAAANAAGIRTAADDTWSDIFSRILVERVEPHLGIGRATLLCDYPRPEAAWARPAPDARLAQRFELFVCGVELANGCAELTDAAEQERRFLAAMAARQRLYGEHYPIERELLAAFATMPPASGIALGFDRLVMLAAGASHIEQVLWAPVADPDAADVAR
ncbi:MAG: EF-P lysine aminoacylase GenX [Proteobacteria bacterium]|nr:EF-P lysine aminoacylase GenX [Pseudomonadota bacterium]